MIFGASFFDHVLDTTHWHIFDSTGFGFHLPNWLTKFVVLQLIAAAVVAFLYIRLARRVQSGEPPRGWGWNALEVILTFIRDQVAKPTLGEEDADRYVPFLWTMFLFILANNLLGLVPFMGSATGSILVTGALALCAFAVIHGAAIVQHGPLHYLKSYFPHIDAPGGWLIGLFIAFIEIFGHFIKTFVLAVRLFANIFAGHMVLAVILSFIAMAKHVPDLLFWPISIGSVLFIVALSLLELFVAFLQAYVFVYLTALFLGSTLHPEH
ncbi:MAG: F0F1 ATP synthase subunit A [Gemmataceae bacterium]|nr:F0F1 ATP synthase subunit A [Gemmataceae bacterium]